MAVSAGFTHEPRGSLTKSRAALQPAVTAAGAQEIARLRLNPAGACRPCPPTVG
jgi:hypothetical protein